jgi:predicted MFS family arabinose efflux permease
VGFITRPGAALAILFGINVLNYLDRYVTAGMLPLIIEDLRITDGQAGALQSVFIFVYAFASPLAGWMGDRIRRIPIATIGVIGFCLATFGSGLSTGFGMLLVFRALVGVGEASYAVVSPSLIADYYPPNRRIKALAFFYAAMPIGTAVGYMLGGAIGTALGWRSAFFITGAPGVLLALSLLLLVEPERGRHDLVRPSGTKRTIAATLQALRARPSYVVNTVAQTIYTFAMGGLAVWMPTYFVRERGLPLAQASFLFGLCLVLAGLLGTVIGGHMGERMARRSPDAPFMFSGVSLVASLPFVLAAVLAPQPAIFWPAMFVTLFLLFLNTGPLNAAMANVLPADLRGSGFAIYTLVIHVFGDGLSPTLIGVASDAWGLRLPVLAAGVLLAIGGLVLINGRKTLGKDMTAGATVAHA